MRWIFVLIFPAFVGCASSAEKRFEGVRSIVEPRADVSLSSPSDVSTAELPEGPLTIDRAVQVALQNNAELRAAYAELEQQIALGRRAARIENPRASGEFRFGDHEAIELEVTQSLTSLLYAGKRAGILGAEEEAAKLRAARTVLDRIFSVRAAYRRHQADRQRAELARTVFAATAASFESAQILFEAGNIPQLDVDRELAEHERARMMLAAAESAEVESRAALDVQMGVWGEATAWEIEGRFADPTESADADDEVERRAVAESLTLASLQQQIAAAASRANLSGWERWVPDLEVGVAAHREGDEDWAVGPVVELEVPLFSPGRPEIAELSRLRATYQFEAVRARAAARAALARVRLSRQRVIHQRKVVLPLYGRIVDETQRRVNAMTSGVFELLAAKREQVAAAQDYVGALESYWMARDALDRLLRGASPQTIAASDSVVSPSSSRSGGGEDH